MFDIGFSELLLVLIIGLIVLGPKRMQELSYIIGKGLANLKKSFDFGQTEIQPKSNQENALKHTPAESDSHE